MFGASLLILFGGTIEHAMLKLWKVDPVLNPLTGGLEILFRIVRYAIALGAAWTLTAILYYYGPYRRQRWRDVWAGAFLATVRRHRVRNRAADLDVPAGDYRAVRL
jgi:uncharacterized BrkB/YihY/UPF0761 family membrane protein